MRNRTQSGNSTRKHWKHVSAVFLFSSWERGWALCASSESVIAVLVERVRTDRSWHNSGKQRKNRWKTSGGSYQMYSACRSTVTEWKHTMFWEAKKDAENNVIPWDQMIFHLFRNGNWFASSTQLIIYFFCRFEPWHPQSPFTLIYQTKNGLLSLQNIHPLGFTDKQSYTSSERRCVSFTVFLQSLVPWSGWSGRIWWAARTPGTSVRVRRSPLGAWRRQMTIYQHPEKKKKAMAYIHALR